MHNSGRDLPVHFLIGYIKSKKRSISLVLLRYRL